MGIITNSWLWFTVGSSVSAVMAVILTDITLQRKYGAITTVFSWFVAICAYFAFVYLGMVHLTSFWYSYLVFFGWLIFLMPPSILIYQDSFSTRLFTTASTVFLANVTTFISGGITTALSVHNPYDAATGYLWSIPFSGIKLIISALTVFLYAIFMKKMVANVFEALKGKMTRFVFVPFIASIGFFFISQTVQTYGIMPDKGFDFILFYFIVCLVFAAMYQLVFSNVLWSSRAMKTEAELNVASSIQQNMLPCIFPAFPEREEFDVYATMLPAKEVGGDFYDFFLVDDNHLAVVMADVSGKSVPAALFMVIAKTLIKNNAQYGKSPKDVFETVNNQLCENNEAGMFVTAFMGILEITTGKFTYVNAGHNPPLIKKANEDFVWLPTKPGFVLAGMEDMFYKQNEITLSSGDVLYMYTDGVTEAVNRNDDLFTEPKLLADINKYKDCDLKEMLVSIKREIDKFANGAEQADDVTMLALKIN